jgi:hypothetical protein
MEMLKPRSREMLRLLQASTTPSSDPAFTPFVAASIEEIRYAQQLRRRIEEQYLSRPAPPVSFWSVGAD